MPPRSEALADLNRAIEDISEIRKMLKAVAAFSVTTVFGVGMWVGTIDTKIPNIEKALATGESRQRDADIVAATITTKLAAIEATLLEIKQALRHS